MSPRHRRRALRDRIVDGLAAALVLGVAAACTTAGQPAASPQGTAASIEEDRCQRDGGIWRHGSCQKMGGGGY
jgi:hypothetical protein